MSAFKPTYGRNPRYGMFQLSYSFDHPCIIATTMADIAAVFSATGGLDASDPSSVDQPVVLEAPLPAPPKIGVLRNFYPAMMEPEMAAAIDAAAVKLKAAGATVVDFELPADFGLVYPLNMLIMTAESAVIGMHDAERLDALGIVPDGKPSTTRRSKFSKPAGPLAGLLPATYYLQAQRVRRWLRDTVNASMEDFDAILTATAPGAAPFDPSISGDASLLTPWSTLGNPTTSIPGGLDPGGMPLGLQLIGPHGRDEHLLATSAWCEDVVGRLPSPAMDW